MDRKPEVLLVTNLFPNPQEPLRGIFVASMVEHLKDLSNVTVISPLPWFPRAKFFQRFSGWYKFSLIPDEFEFAGIHVYAPKFIAPPRIGVLHPLFMFFVLLPIVARLKREKNIELLNAHWIFPDGITVSWVSKIVNLPVVLSAHGCDLNHYTKSTFRSLMIMPALKSADAVTVVSEAQKNVVCRKGVASSGFYVTQNGADMQRFSVRDKKVCREKLGLQAEKKIILFIGQLLEVKGIEYLLEAVKLMVDHKSDDFQVIILGEGCLRKRLKKMVTEGKLEHIVEMPGNKKYEEIPLWLGAADLLCLPSLREGCPCVVVESLASGRPVVASRVGGIPDLVDEKNGILVNARDPKMLAEGLRNALNKEWDSKVIRESVRDLTWETVARRYYNVFKQVLTTKGAEDRCAGLPG